MATFLTQISSSWLVSIAGLTFLLFKVLRFGHREKYLPPGPPTLPILGNAHLIPSKNLHLKLKEWSDQYGTIFSLKVGRSTIVVINDRRAVHELVDKKGVLYSDRPKDQQMRLVFAQDGIGFLDANSRWRSNRKIAAQLLAPQKLDGKLAAVQEAETSVLMLDLLERPEEFRSSVKRMTASTASIITHGYRAPHWSSFWAQASYMVMELATKAVQPGAYLPVDQFPILKLIPERLTPSRQLAKAARRVNDEVWSEARARVDKRRGQGCKRDSLIDRLLDGETRADLPMTDSQLNHFLGGLNEGATDTTATATLTNILYLAKYPEFQKKARIELDRVCGTDRIPKWSDFENLPYINCIVKEGLRIQPVAPNGLPHCMRQDDWYDGMLIPKGATVFISPYALHYSFFSDPSTYNPDRFVDHPKLANVYASCADYESRDHYSYGAGRRRCVGIHLAERVQWRILAYMLWAFNIEPAVDENGEEVELDVTAYIEGLIRTPLPYKVKFTPRSERHAEVVRREFGEVEQLLKEWE